MSFVTPDTTVAGVTTDIPGLAAGSIPANIRNGNAAAKEAYGEGLQFEQILVNQMVQSMSSDISDMSDSDGASDTNQTGLLAGGNSAMGMYSGLLDQSLTTSIMAGGGLGIAAEVASDLDPAIEAPTAIAVGSGSTNASSGAVAS